MNNNQTEGGGEENNITTFGKESWLYITRFKKKELYTDIALQLINLFFTDVG